MLLLSISFYQEYLFFPLHLNDFPFFSIVSIRLNVPYNSWTLCNSVRYLSKDPIRFISKDNRKTIAVNFTRQWKFQPLTTRRVTLVRVRWRDRIKIIIPIRNNEAAYNRVGSARKYAIAAKRRIKACMYPPRNMHNARQRIDATRAHKSEARGYGWCTTHRLGYFLIGHVVLGTSWPPCERFASRLDEKRRRFRGVHGRINGTRTRQFSGIIRSFR